MTKNMIERKLKFKDVEHLRRMKKNPLIHDLFHFLWENCVTTFSAVPNWIGVGHFFRFKQVGESTQ